MIYSGPSYEMRDNASINVNIQIDGKSENMILKRAMVSPAEIFKQRSQKDLNNVD